MNKRWLIGGGAVVLGMGAYFILHDRGPAAAMTRPARPVAINLQHDPLAPAVAADPLAPQPLPKKFVKPVPVLNPKNGSYEMPMIDAVPDPEGEAREKFLYTVHRMKLAVGDEASRCYTGGDGKAEIDIGYTMVVENEVLSAQNVHVIDDGLGDPSLTACITNAIRDMRQLQEGMPNEKTDREFRMSQHDFYVRNHQDQSNVKGHNDDTMTEFDRPTVVPTPPKKP